MWFKFWYIMFLLDLIYEHWGEWGDMMWDVWIWYYDGAKDYWNLFLKKLGDLINKIK